MSWTTIGGNDPARYSSMVAGRGTFCSPEGILAEPLGNGIPLNWEEKEAGVLCEGVAKRGGVGSPVTRTGSLSSDVRSFNWTEGRVRTQRIRANLPSTILSIDQMRNGGWGNKKRERERERERALFFSFSYIKRSKIFLNCDFLIN